MGEHTASLAELVLSALAQACNRESSSVSLESAMADLDMDSLTLISVLARVEAVYDTELAPDDTLPLLEASTAGELIERLSALVERS